MKTQTIANIVPDAEDPQVIKADLVITFAIGDAHDLLEHKEAGYIASAVGILKDGDFPTRELAIMTTELFVRACDNLARAAIEIDHMVALLEVAKGVLKSQVKEEDVEAEAERMMQKVADTLSCGEREE